MCGRFARSLGRNRWFVSRRQSGSSRVPGRWTSIGNSFRLPWGKRYAAAGGFGLFPAVVVPVLRALQTMASADAGVARRRSRISAASALGVVVRSVEGGDHRGSAGVGGGTAEERGVLAVLAALRLRDPGLPAVSRRRRKGRWSVRCATSGTGFCYGLGSSCRTRTTNESGAALAGDGGQRPGPRDVEGGPVGSLRAGAFFVGSRWRRDRIRAWGRCLLRPRIARVLSKPAADPGGAPESGGVWAARGGAGMTSVSRHERISGQLVDLKHRRGLWKRWTR